MNVIISPLIDVVRIAISIYIWILIIQAVMSWLLAFNIINSHNRFVGNLGMALYRLTEPVLGRIRSFLPNLGMVDISPIIVLLALWYIDGVLANLTLKLM